MVRTGDAVSAARDLEGRRVGAIAGSTNLALAETFPGVECVPFDGVSDDVFGDMLRALSTGEVDAVVDDDVAFIGIENTHPGLRVAFTVATRNPGAACCAAAKTISKPARRRHRAGRPAAAWRDWLPSLTYPL